MRKSLKSANGPVGGRVAPPTPVCTPQLGSQHPRCPQPTGRENLAGNSVSGQFWLTRCHQAETRINRPASFLRAEARQGGCQGPQLGPLLLSAWFLPGETHLAWVPGPPGPRSGVPGVCRGRWGRGLLCGSGLDRVFLSLFGVSQTPCCPPSISQRQQTLPGACLQPGADPEAGGTPPTGLSAWPEVSQHIGGSQTQSVPCAKGRITRESPGLTPDAQDRGPSAAIRCL